MGGLMNSHHPLPFAFGILGNFVSFSVYLSPAITFYRIYRRKSTEGFDCLPYSTALFSSMLWLYYATLKQENALLLITINSFGCVIETIYIAMYFTYATRQTRLSTLKTLALMDLGGLVLTLAVAQFLFHGSIRVKVVGWICVAVSICVFAAPLIIVAKVIRTKSVEFMPFTLTFTLTLSAITWFFYGYFIDDWCVAIPNVIGFILGVIQMILYAIYKNAKIVVVEDDKLPEDLRTIVIIATPKRNSEVYPIDIELYIREPSVNEKSDEKEKNKEDENGNDKKAEEKINKPQVEEIPV